MPADILKFEKRPKPKPEPEVAARQAKTSGGGRFEALDVLRGLFMCGMLLANNAGDWGHIYTQMDHADWHGFTLTDMVFPGFMTVVGISMTLSLGRRMADGGKTAMIVHIARRAAILVGIGLFLNLLPDFDLAHWRFPGVLQRTGICYFLASMLMLLHSHVSKDGKLVIHPLPLALWASGLILAYALLLRFVPVPGFPLVQGAAPLQNFGSVASWPAYVDRIVFTTNHVWQQALTDGKITYDPEGLLSTFPAIFNILAGLLIGLYIKDKTPKGAWVGVMMLGIVLMIAGVGLDPQVPIIKKLWTSSFALLTSGFAMFVLSLLMVVMDQIGWRAWAFPLRVFGTNAILAYVAAWVLAVLFDVAGISGRVTHWLSSVIHDPYAMSATYAFGFLVLIWLLLLPFYLKRWFIKV